MNIAYIESNHIKMQNYFIILTLLIGSGFPKEKVLISLDRFGNTSSSSIPITLVYKYGDCDDERMINALCCGFGVGLSWSTVALPIDVKDILPLVHTDEFFEDGYPREEIEE